MNRIAVVGAGTMGNGIAQVFAQQGKPVALIDVKAAALQRALATIRANLERQARKGGRVGGAGAGGELLADGPEAVLARISGGEDLRAAADADLVVEAAPEDPAVKFDLFRQLDRICQPEAILASNTSAISITEIAAHTSRPGRVIGMHFMNPVPVMPLVEVVRGHATTDATTQAVVETATALGKTPVVVNDYPGFVANRILMPMINEAVYCVMEGVAARDAVDTVMKLGMNHPMGPLQLADLIGLDVCLAILEVMHRGLGDPKYRPCPLLRRMVAAGHLGRKTGRGFYEYQIEGPRSNVPEGA